MASSTDKTDPEIAKEVPVSSKPGVSSNPPPRSKFQLLDVVLRVLLFLAILTSVVVMVTSQQTELVTVPGIPFQVPLQAKFSHSPAFIYFVAALSVAGLHALLTAFASIATIFKPGCSTVFLFHFLLVDTIMLGLVASATGTAGGVAYIGLKGNSHVNWGKVCPTYEKFCHHLGSSIALALIASVLLVLLVMLSSFTLYTRIRK